MTSFYGIGLMSGTSTDGLDICYAEFTGDVDTDVWSYRILRAMTLDYTPEWREKLRNASNLSGLDLIKLHVEYGRYLGETVDDFIDSEDAKPCFVASHGHTVFHQPGAHLTFQLGDGETSAAYLHCPFVCNFRSKDVALGGQGAPLVSVGERHLFGHVDVCINLGGVANLSLKGESGHDVCGCNIVLNMLAEKHDNTLTHDVDGQIANSGEVLEDVLSKLESLDYYKMKPPKSLGLEWITESVFPILDTSKFRIADLMCTYCEHIARQLDKAACETAFISKSSDTTSRSPPHRSPAPVSVLVTGGGVFNRCVIDRLEVKLRANNMVLADREIDTVQFKEALLFAFLGLRCLLGLQNVNSEATGSSTDTVSGSIHLPPHHNSHNHSRVGFSLRRSSSTD